MFCYFWWKDDPDMMHDEEAAGTRCPEVWKFSPKNAGPNIKSIKFLGSGGGVKTRVDRISGNNKIFRPYGCPK